MRGQVFSPLGLSSNFAMLSLKTALATGVRTLYKKYPKSGARRSAWLESRTDKRSTRGRAGEGRKQALSGQVLCRSSTGAACRGGFPCRCKNQALELR
jgi:hypothetical protein